jgi:hypothetical protein
VAKPSNDKVLIRSNERVKVTKMNHIVEVQHMEKMNTEANIKKLDKDTYVDLKTGEIKEFNHTENRQENHNSLRQTFKKLRYLINNNFVGNPNELHVTLTYKENMTDTKRLYEDYKNFIKRLKYQFKNKTTIDYISVVEPQERGAWHCHSLMRFNELDKVFIKNKDLRELWGNGFVKIRALENVDNIGAYLSAYLSDIELTEENLLDVFKNGSIVESKTVNGTEKKFIKGGRLHMYPPGMNIFRKSKGIVHPERLEMRYGEIKKIVGSAQPHYEKSYQVENEDFKNTITYIQYNMKRNTDNANDIEK